APAAPRNALAPVRTRPVLPPDALELRPVTAGSPRSGPAVSADAHPTRPAAGLVPPGWSPSVRMVRAQTLAPTRIQPVLPPNAMELRPVEPVPVHAGSRGPEARGTTPTALLRPERQVPTGFVRSGPPLAEPPDLRPLTPAAAQVPGQAMAPSPTDGTA